VRSEAASAKAQEAFTAAMVANANTCRVTIVKGEALRAMDKAKVGMG
jgi:hypothetical protein